MNHKITRSSPSYTSNSDRPARWKITSNWSNFAVIRQYLVLKWVYSELSKEEYFLLLDTMNPSFDMFMIVNKLFKELKSKKEIQILLNKYYSKNKKESYNESIYKFLRSQANKSLKIEIYFTRRRKGEKYSGWRRHQNDQGSLGTQVEKDFRNLIPADEENREQKLFTTLLTVSES